MHRYCNLFSVFSDGDKPAETEEDTDLADGSLQHLAMAPDAASLASSALQVA
jgi:hypothetical protein